MFTFGQQFLQGIQAGQRNRQSQDQLAFQREAQAAVHELNQQRFRESTRQFDDTRDDTKDRFDKTFGLQETTSKANILHFQNQDRLSQDAQTLTENRFLDVEINGQVGKIDAEAFLRIGISRADLRFRKEQAR